MSQLRFDWWAASTANNLCTQLESSEHLFQAAAVAIGDLYPNALSLARKSATNGLVSSSVPVDSGLKSMQTQAQGFSVQLNTIVQGIYLILIDNPNSVETTRLFHKCKLKTGAVQVVECD